MLGFIELQGVCSNMLFIYMCVCIYIYIVFIEFSVGQWSLRGVASKEQSPAPRSCREGQIPGVDLTVSHAMGDAIEGIQNFESSTWETDLWPSKSYVKALGPNVTVYGNRTFQEVIQVK